MGMRTDHKIRSWQEQAGITEATGERAQTLRQMSNAAFELIKVIELERSGIRDGDGCWYGSDVVGGAMSDLTDLFEKLDLIDKAAHKAAVAPTTTREQAAPPISANDDEMPF